jgi:hypothetical protein
MFAIGWTVAHICRPSANVGTFLQPQEMGSTLLGSYSKKCLQFLHNVLTAAAWTLHLLLVVFCQRQNLLKDFVAILAKIVINGHGRPPGISGQTILNQFRACRSLNNMKF